ncbi:UTRA domain-containing protein [Qipengyuania aquimaris]|uniref:UTRA domain-containing protein n=1 Tax=Qipengyuania aquimaris TaxID=255984 RepID=UPI001FD14515|nr:UTRA domain-containing protein [Qipengyuania aquimaris]UOR15820.1 UTRA domain-containing protein [Qipengyuania aquimaris]
MTAVTHSSIREDIRKRIVAGEWGLGEQMPGEIDLASEYGCSRTTMNRALRALADEGMIERKRKGGTRVRPLPLPKAQLRIPIIREQVEARGLDYSSKVIHRKRLSAKSQTHIPPGTDCIYLESLHMAGSEPFAYEKRWVNLAAVSEFEHVDLSEISANEWLVRTVPFSRGNVALAASNADAAVAEMLNVPCGNAVFTMQRNTWLESAAITAATLFFPPEYRLEFEI